MTADPRTSPLPALSLLLVGSLGFAAIWILSARLLDTQAAWLAPLGALDAALMLRLGRMPARWPRMAWCLLATPAIILLANWGIAATEIGRSMGLLPWESALRLGPSYAWELIRLANGPVEMAWYALAMAVAAASGLSGRRPAPSAH
ncbi:MAG TPA: hypothetical protein VN205_12155 [Thermomonas sp.]|nr:hypothetical protein [Thermomonas sp.]